ncbi:MAG: hypothetical protein QW561_02315 [Candidatus Aenigmatarchaeota archaeon]
MSANKKFGIHKKEAVQMYKLLIKLVLVNPKMDELRQKLFKTGEPVKPGDITVRGHRSKILQYANKVKEVREVRKRLHYPPSPNKTEIFKKLKSRAIRALTEPLESSETEWDDYSLKVKNFRWDLLEFLTCDIFEDFLKEKGKWLEPEMEVFDRKNRGWFRKYNFYFINPERKAAILQEFIYKQWKSKEYSTSRKSYYLIYLKDKQIKVKPVEHGKVKSIVTYNNLKTLDSLLGLS